MKPRFLADADLHFDIVTGVLRREPAIDFQSAQELLAEGMHDPDVLAIAAQLERILVSHDVSTIPERTTTTRGRLEVAFSDCVVIRLSEDSAA